MQLDIYNRLAYCIFSTMWTGMDFFPGLDREYFLAGGEGGGEGEGCQNFRGVLKSNKWNCFHKIKT